MQTRLWMILALGFGALTALLAVLGAGSLRRAQEIQTDLRVSQERFVAREYVLQRISGQLYTLAILTRDCLLSAGTPEERETTLTLEAEYNAMEKLRTELRHLAENDPTVQSLNQELGQYLTTVLPVFSWTAAQKLERGRAFLKDQVLLKREAVTELARRASRMNAASWREQNMRTDQRQDELQIFLRRMTFGAVAVGVIAAAFATVWSYRLERTSQMQQQRARNAERELRRLSSLLVHAQEEERKVLSRELHDQVGQMLTAIRMEIGYAETVAKEMPDRIRERITEAKRLSEEAVVMVRDIATGLRPSVLDHFGLGPALEWQGREFARHSGIPVEMRVEGDLSDLPESHRTCIFRVVQEALTNSARHAQASHVSVSVFGGKDHVQLAIQDDGKGFDASDPHRRGLGLLGIEERVRELGGSVSIFSRSGKGTSIEISIPLKALIT